GLDLSDEVEEPALTAQVHRLRFVNRGKAPHTHLSRVEFVDGRLESGFAIAYVGTEPEIDGLHATMRTQRSRFTGGRRACLILTGAHQKGAFGCSAGLQSRIGLGLVLLIGYSLTRFTSFPDPGFGRKQNAAAPAFFGNFRIQRKYPWFPRQQMRIVKIAIAHIASRWVK